ncbi:hypothetical protein ARMSODRAFT_449818 [Armillaria solidipes]|uniref:Uncharacterized protein n=1 Tax=Armillaria solidipes TaxID=1076256 RepID=A0A2H3B2D1_9AGAR|nr:hypothetical protein ARMSODRAFT_449818 [Armillaria solidipes]
MLDARSPKKNTPRTAGDRCMQGSRYAATPIFTSVILMTGTVLGQGNRPFTSGSFCGDWLRCSILPNFLRSLAMSTQLTHPCIRSPSSR